MSDTTGPGASAKCGNPSCACWHEDEARAASMSHRPKCPCPTCNDGDLMPLASHAPWKRAGYQLGQPPDRPLPQHGEVPFVFGTPPPDVEWNQRNRAEAMKRELDELHALIESVGIRHCYTAPRVTHYVNGVEVPIRPRHRLRVPWYVRRWARRTAIAAGGGTFGYGAVELVRHLL